VEPRRKFPHPQAREPISRILPRLLMDHTPDLKLTSTSEIGAMHIFEFSPESSVERSFDPARYQELFTHSYLETKGVSSYEW